MSDEPVVYIVDDDADARKSVSNLVESMGLRAEAFASAEYFLGRVNNSCQGCVVTDVRMLRINGLELQERLLGQDIPLPVIVITAYADIPLAVRAMQNGAVTPLENPCREQELWDSIRTALKLDQLVNAQNTNPGFVVQIPEGLCVNIHNNSNFTHQ